MAREGEDFSLAALASKAREVQGDKIYVYRVLKPFAGLRPGTWIMADCNAVDVQALVATDRDDLDSVIGFWPRASVPLIGVAQDLGLLEWDSCSERAWNLSARRGSNHSRLQLISGRTG